MSNRFVVIALAIFLSIPCSAASASWTCKPVWSFSGMGDKTYEGASTDEAVAKDTARKACVLDNRGLELDDFCLPEPKGNDWRCAQGQRQAVDATPQADGH